MNDIFISHRCFCHYLSIILSFRMLFKKNLKFWVFGFLLSIYLLSIFYLSIFYLSILYCFDLQTHIKLFFNIWHWCIFDCLAYPIYIQYSNMSLVRAGYRLKRFLTFNSLENLKCTNRIICLNLETVCYIILQTF